MCAFSPKNSKKNEASLFEAYSIRVCLITLKAFLIWSPYSLRRFVENRTQPRFVVSQTKPVFLCELRYLGLPILLVCWPNALQLILVTGHPTKAEQKYREGFRIANLQLPTELLFIADLRR